MVTPEQRRTVVEHAMETAGLSERQACRYTGFVRSSQRYHAIKGDAALRERLHTLALRWPRWGYRRLYRLLRCEGLRVNRKRVQRVYRGAGLHVRQRPRKRVALERVPKPAITGANQRWSMDFVSDALADGRRFRNLTVVDDATRECLLIEVERSLPAGRVIAALDRVARSRGYAPSIVCDNGLRFRSEALDQWPINTGSRWRSSNQVARAERLHRELQRTFSGRVSERALVSRPRGCQGHH